MTRLLRLSLVVAILLVMAILLAVGLPAGLLLTALAPAPTNAVPLTADLTPTPTPYLSATLRLSPSRTTVAVGQTVRLTTDLSVVGGCGYGIMELTVAEDSDGEPVFAHVDPPVDTIGSGVSFPSLWTFRALRPGAAEFAAGTFGEGNCDGAWFWHTEGTRTGPVQVLELPYRLYVPTVSRP